MIYNNTDEKFLIYKIQDFVNRAGVTHIDQVQRMFRLYGEGTVEHQIIALALAHNINYDRETGLLKSRMAPVRSQIGQEMLTKALWVMAAFGDQKIDAYWLMAPPSQLAWIESDNMTVRDVTVFYPMSVSSLAQVWRANQQALIPKGVDDCFDHIALLYTEDDAETVMRYGFNRYCILEKGTNKPIFYPNI